MEDMMDEVVMCKYCNKKELYGNMRWLEGRCECPKCYAQHRAELDNKNKKAEEQNKW